MIVGRLPEASVRPSVRAPGRVPGGSWAGPPQPLPPMAVCGCMLVGGCVFVCGHIYFSEI